MNLVKMRIPFDKYRGFPFCRELCGNNRSSHFSGVASVEAAPFLIGAFRCGNKPPVLPGDNKKSGATIKRAC